jgi:hypothetical protein
VISTRITGGAGGATIRADFRHGSTTPSLSRENSSGGRKDSVPDFPAKIVIAITVQHCPIQSCIIGLDYLMEIAKMGPDQTLPHALNRTGHSELEIESESLSSEGCICL